MVNGKCKCDCRKIKKEIEDVQRSKFKSSKKCVHTTRSYDVCKSLNIFEFKTIEMCVYTLYISLKTFLCVAV